MFAGSRLLLPVYINFVTDAISDPYLVSCIFHIAKAIKPTPCYKRLLYK